MTSNDEVQNEQTGRSIPSRVTAVLYALTEREEGLSVRAIAEATGNSRSSTHRILQALCEEGYAEQRDEGRHIAGPKLLQLAARVFGIVPVMRVADAIMVRLVKEVGETSYLAAYSPEDQIATFVHRVETDAPVRHIQPLGTRIPLHAGAIGKAILAALPEVDTAALDLTPYTARTPVSLADLKKEIDTIRAKGYAISVEERVTGFAGVSAPIMGSERVVGGLTVGVPTSRIPAAGLDGVGEVVKRYADELSGVLKAMGVTRF